MRLQKLEIEGFKGFKDKVELVFPKDNKPVVLLGINGAGKTTILEAVIACLRQFANEMLDNAIVNDSLYPRYFVHNSSDVESAIVNLYWEYTDGFDSDYAQQTTSVKINKTLKKIFEVEKGTIPRLAEDIRTGIPFVKNISIATYYPTERMVLDTPMPSRDISRLNQFNAFDKAFERAVDFKDFFEWFRNTEDIENEIRLNEDQTYMDIGLESVRRAITEFLEGFGKLRVQRSPVEAMVVLKNGEKLFFEQLSYGEKALLTLVGDLARRLAIANPALKNPLIGKGVVLIDEIDQHLHPRWQRTIIKKLRAVFPNIQFIVTTHSTLVASHITSESIYILDNFQCENLKDKYPDFNSFGADIEDTLELIQSMDILVPDELQEMFAQYFETIRDGELEHARKIQAKLKKMTDPNHPKILQGEAEIKYKELLSE